MHEDSLPSVYPAGTDTKAHAVVHSVVFQSVDKGCADKHAIDEVPIKYIRREKFTLDVGHTHVVEAIG